MPGMATPIIVLLWSPTGRSGGIPPGCAGGTGGIGELWGAAAMGEATPIIVCLPAAPPGRAGAPPEPVVPPNDPPNPLPKDVAPPANGALGGAPAADGGAPVPAGDAGAGCWSPGFAAGIPIMVPLSLLGPDAWGGGADISGAMPTIVRFIALAESSLGRIGSCFGADGSVFGDVSSAAPHTPQCASAGPTDDPHRGQTIMPGAYHAEVAGSPEFE
jgi:hypothetical protein